MTPRVRLVACLVLAVVVAAVPAPTDGATGFDVSVSPSIDVPDRDATYEGDEYTLTELGRVQRGEPIVASVDVHESTEAAILLIDEDHNVVGGDEGTGDGEHAFSTGNRDPGTYVVALRVDGEIVDLEPVVVAAYDVSVEAPDRVAAGSTIDVRAELTALESAPAPRRVAVVVGDGRERLRATLSRDDGTTYAGTVDASGLQPGTYSLHVVALGIEQLFDDEKVVLGASDPQSFRIGEPPTETATRPTDGGEGGTSDGGGGGGGDGNAGGGGGGSAGGGGGDGGSSRGSDGGVGSGGGGGTDATGGSGGGSTGLGGATSATPDPTTGPGRQETSAGAVPSTSADGGPPASPGQTPSTNPTGRPTASDPPEGDPTGVAGTGTGQATSGGTHDGTETATPGQSLGTWPVVVGLVVAILLALRRD